MKSLITRFAPLASFAIAASALAADEAGHDGPKAGVLPTIEQGIVPMLVSIVVFSVVLAVLSAKVWPAISKGLADREAKIKNEIESAEAARMQAKAALDQYERALADARAEAQKEIEKAKAAAMAAANEIKARNETDMAAQKAKFVQEIDAAKKAALGEIYAHAAGLATLTAGKILQREIQRGDQQQLVSESLSELKASGKHIVNA
jgi:F-type H+-transporting ATPase subunit b